MPSNTQQCEVGSHSLSQQDSCTSSPSLEGSSEPPYRTSSKGVTAQMHLPKLKHPALPSLFWCLQGRDKNWSQSGRCIKSQHLDLSRSLCGKQRSHLVSLSHPHVLYPLSVPCLVLRKSAVLNWANLLLFVFCMFSLGEEGQGDVGVIQHNTEITASKWRFSV